MIDTKRKISVQFSTFLIYTICWNFSSCENNFVSDLEADYLGIDKAHDNNTFNEDTEQLMEKKT